MLDLTRQIKGIFADNPRLFDSILPRSEHNSEDIIADWKIVLDDVYTSVLVSDIIAESYARDKLILLVYGSKIDAPFKQAIAGALKREYTVTLSFYNKPLL